MALTTEQLRSIRNSVMRDGLVRNPDISKPIIQNNAVQLAWIDAELDRLEITKKIEAYRQDSKHKSIDGWGH